MLENAEVAPPLTPAEHIWGDVDKPFHFPECECDQCEVWRRVNNRKLRRPIWRQMMLIKPLTPAVGFALGLCEYMPKREQDKKLSPSLADIDAHMPAGHIYSNAADPVNWAHETTHGINNDIRNHVLNGVNALYCLQNQTWILREPKFRKRDVLRFVPEDERKEGWKMYMEGQTAWDSRPLYILDEYSAYINGAVVHAEYLKLGAHMDRSYSADIKSAVAFRNYSHAVLRAVDELDPTYADRAILVATLEYQDGRLQELPANMTTKLWTKVKHLVNPSANRQWAHFSKEVKNV